MNAGPTLFDLQASVQDNAAFAALSDYQMITDAFLTLIAAAQPTRIVAPNDHRYIFYQYGAEFGHKITRPLNGDLFIESTALFQESFGRFRQFLLDLKTHKQNLHERPSVQSYLQSGEINKIVYTAQQSIGGIGDSFDNPNQSRKRIGQLFENLVKLIIQELGFDCESRTLSVPIPDFPDHVMSYELDLVFSPRGAVVVSESELIHPQEVIGSVKTTRKDRLDKIFLDKFLLTKLLGREVNVVAIFLHDVQRARRANSIFGINSTFKTNHFLGYTVALNRLNGVYYVDPRPEMRTNPRLNQEINDFQHFLTHDIWR
jgi:hypothetical protein